MHNLQQCPEEKLQLFEIKPLLLANLWRLFLVRFLGVFVCLVFSVLWIFLCILSVMRFPIESIN